MRVAEIGPAENREGHLPYLLGWVSMQATRATEDARVHIAPAQGAAISNRLFELRDDVLLVQVSLARLVAMFL